MAAFAPAFAICLITCWLALAAAQPDYSDALSKSILFFEAQRSGKLPSDQRLSWRQDSAIHDGRLQSVDLEGGYYDAGDNVKFGFPMAFTTTLLSWSVIEYAQFFDNAGELNYARNAIRWGADYLLKATSIPNVIYAQIGDPNVDHSCWERPEDMDTPRTVYQVDSTHPGSDLAAEMAAALAAASLVFRDSEFLYSRTLLYRSKQVFRFANAFKGPYSATLSSAVCPFYCSYSGYQDELLWGAAWLYKASGSEAYLRYILTNNEELGGTTESPPAFSWDNKYAGAQVLLATEFLAKKRTSLEGYKERADHFLCSIMPYPSSPATLTPGGLIFYNTASNLQYVTTGIFLLFTYGRHLSLASQDLTCGDTVLSPDNIWNFAKTQVDYILGENPRQMSYMIGYGSKFPQHVHHRGSSMPSLASHPQHIGCGEGFSYFASTNADPNLLVGGVVGGPDGDDNYADDRSNYVEAEPTTYINAPLVGALAYLTGA